LSLKDIYWGIAFAVLSPIIFILALRLVCKLEQDHSAYGFLKYLEEDEIEKV
jgi:hypothetical protein